MYSLLYQTTTEAEDDDVTSAVTESTMSLSTQDQRHLQNKLRELQMKKQHMDQLLDELQSLKIGREMLNNGQRLSCLNDFTLSKYEHGGAMPKFLGEPNPSLHAPFPALYLTFPCPSPPSP